jgi:hypothetical protein
LRKCLCESNRAINALYAVLDDAHVFHDAAQMTDKLRRSGLLLEVPGPFEVRGSTRRVLCWLGACAAASTNNTPQSPNNLREDVWYGALQLAQELARKRKVTDNWPAKLKPHVTRRTFITHLFEIGESPPYAQEQVGHADSALTLEVYADVSSRRGPVPTLRHNLYETDRTRRVES